MKGRAARALAACAFVTALGGLAPSACKADAPLDPSFVLVELTPVTGHEGRPRSAHVEVLDGPKSLASLCIRLDDAKSDPKPASFVLKRDPKQDAKPRATIEVTGFAALSGDENADAGKEFACPGSFPPPLVATQRVDVGFCSSKAVKVSFLVGATCGCEPGGTGGGGGASSTSNSTGPGSGGAGGAGGGGGGGGSAGGGGASGGGGGAGGAGGAATASSSSSATTGSGGSGGGGGSVVCTGCGKSAACGAGLSVSGSACREDECCQSAVSNACALETVQ